MKLTELDYSKIKFIKKQINNSTIINVKYSGSESELINFQTPKVYFHEIINNEYLILHLIDNSSTHKFINNINNLNNYYSESNHIKLNEIITNGCTLKVKIQYFKDHPVIKIWNKDNEPVNFYSLHKFINCKIICLLNSKHIWINDYSEPSHNLIVEEILII
jgi:hypothetical protein